MLTKQQLDLIATTIKQDSRFQGIINEAIAYEGKEKGHTFASPMEDVITTILIEKLGATKPDATRDIADLEIYKHIFNTKFGASLKNGSPNMCSMRKILKLFITEPVIDSYYIIKVKLNEANCDVDIFDMFDIPECLRWNAGTGQIMINEKYFYTNDIKDIKVKNLLEKKINFRNNYEKGMIDHITLRQKQLDVTLTEIDKTILELQKQQNYSAI